MSRVLAVFAACLLLLCAGSAFADSVADNVAQLGTDTNARARITAALALAKTRDPRAINALALALKNDSDSGVRKFCAIALEKMIDSRTAPDALQLGLGALEEAANGDSDQRVREIAGRAHKALAHHHRARKTPDKQDDRPSAVFVNVDATTDQSKQLPPGGGDRLMRIVKQNVERTGYSTSWRNGQLPTSAELSSSRTRGFIVASTVKKIEITKLGSQTQIACTVSVRIAPWTGRDGGERWEANRAASASGSAKAMTGNRDRDIQGGVRDCLEAVAEDVTSRQVVPFLKRLATSGS